MVAAALEIDDDLPIVRYTISSTPSTGPFAVPFPLPTDYATALKVAIDGVETTDWTFAPDSDVAGGYPTGEVTLTYAQSDCEITLWRRMPLARTVDYANGPLDMAGLNAELAYTIMRLQDTRLRATQVWRTGAGAPDDADGLDGDMYINVTNGDLYGPKALGAWGAAVGNLIDDVSAAAIAAKVSDVPYNATSWNGVTDVAPSKNVVRDLYEALLGGVASAFDTLAEIATDLGLKALKATTISAAGLATGGGDLSGNRTITVTAATDAEARAQVSAGVALTPANLAGRACFSAHKNGSAQASIANNTFTKLTFATEAFDVGSAFDTTNSRWTPPAGKVRLSGAFYSSAGGSASGGLVLCAIYKNGALFRQGISRASAADFAALVTAIDTANGTDYYELFCYGPSGATWTADGGASNTYFQGEQI